MGIPGGLSESRDKSGVLEERVTRESGVLLWYIQRAHHTCVHLIGYVCQGQNEVKHSCPAVLPEVMA